MSLKDKAIKSVFWSAVEQVGPRIVQFIVLVILARLLMPAEFGLIGMLTVFIALGHIFLDSGFGSALIQKQDATETHYTSVFYANLLLSLLTATALWEAAPWIARFYKQPALVSLTRVLAFNFIFAALGVIQTTLMTKELDFKTQAKVRLIAVTGSGVIGIGMAFMHFGVWSLVGQTLSGTLLDSLTLWFFSRWRPGRNFSLSALRELFGFSSRLLGSGVLDALFRNAYNVAIGKLFAPSELGYYTRARSIQQIPSQTMGGVVGRVAFPVFSRMQGEPERMKNAVRKALKTIALVNFPMMIGLIVTARPLVLVLLGKRWEPAVPFLQMLAIVGLFYPLSMVNLNVLLANGRSDLMFRLEIIKKSMVALNIGITWRWGIKAIIAGQIVTAITSYYLNSYKNGDLIAYPFKAQVTDLLPYMGVAGMMGGAVYMLHRLPFMNDAIMLMSQVVVGGILYVVVCRICRLAMFEEVRNLFFAKIV
ncbi:MAG: lipopolysaccharide biosynthesis protein [Deltaproteobacteria bacterium]|nr:lipopolysaccharide biosynthesis protein [Deltaproteobacteria bacterium]